MTPTFKMSSLKFDSGPVIREFRKGRHEALTQIGKFLHKRMRTSMRDRKKASKPGDPPSAHTRMLKEGIRSAIDYSTGSVVIGPTKTNQVFFNGDGKPVRGTVPGILDRGGEIQVFEVRDLMFYDPRTRKPLKKPVFGWKRADLRSRRRIAVLQQRLRKITIAARPFTAPALAEVINNKKLENAFKEIM